jgi:hypothetical protein
MVRMTRRAAWVALAMAMGCSNTPAKTTATTGSGSPTGATTTTTGTVGTTATASSDTGSDSTSTDGSTGSDSTGTTGTTGASTGGSTGSTGALCIPDGSFAGLGQDFRCCSGVTDDQGYCGNNAGTTGTTASNATTTTGTTGTTAFGGGWHPPDSGYQPASIGDGGVTTLVGPGVSANAPNQFGGADAPNAKPTIVYPPDGVMMPPNVNSLEIHFVPGAGQTLFEVAFHAPTANLVVYTQCTPLGAGCVYTPDQAFWNDLVSYARGAQPVTYTIRGVNGGSPGAVGTSAPRSIVFSDQDILGGIYFWNTGGTVERYDWGIPGAPVETWLSPRTAGAATCVGCHVLSRDGDKGVAGKDIPSPANYGVFDVATTQPVQVNGHSVTGQGNFFSFSPDGRYLAYSDGNKIGYKDLSSNTIVSANALQGTMPDWSPAGDDMVLAKGTVPPFGFAVPGVDHGAIQKSHYNGAGFDPPAILVPYNGQNNYYPAYGPTGDWVVFNRSPQNANSFANAAPDPDAGTTPDGELWAVSAQGGAARRLDNASDPGALSWPKWAPVLNDYYGGHVMWITFSSQRAYGLRVPAGSKTQLWMVAFDPARAAQGLDPSFPAFYLPFQDTSGGNHIAQWVTNVARPPCTQNSDCPSNQACVQGKCKPVVINHRPHASSLGDVLHSQLHGQVKGAATAPSPALSRWLDR